MRPANRCLHSCKRSTVCRPPAQSPRIRVEAEPGKAFRYPGGGYSVIQQLLMDVTGKSFPDLMQDLVLGRLGLLL